jgi:hypothetical protein
MVGQQTRIRTIPGVGAQTVDIQWYIVLATVRTRTRRPDRVALAVIMADVIQFIAGCGNTAVFFAFPISTKQLSSSGTFIPSSFHVRKISLGYGTVQEM